MVAKKTNSSPNNKQQATSAKDWQKVKTMVLPSENVIDVKRVGLIELVKRGKVPQPLRKLAVEAVTRKEARQNLKEVELVKYADLVDVVFMACSVTPKVTEDGEGETLAVEDVEFADKQEVYKWANGMANFLRPFRPESEGNA